jgi:hypothetical protein
MVVDFGPEIAIDDPGLRTSVGIPEADSSCHHWPLMNSRSELRNVDDRIVRYR